MKEFILNPCNRYFLLWCLNNLNGFLYPEGTVLNKIFMVLILLVSFKELVYFLMYERPREKVFFKGLNALLLMYTVYGLLVFVTDGITVYSKFGDTYASVSFIQGAYVILLPIYVCYLYTRRGYLTAELLQKWAVAFIFVCIAQYYTLQQDIMRRLLSQGSNETEFNNGGGYIFLSIIPMMLVYRSKLLSYIGTGIALVFILMAMKRGAIIISAIALVIIIYRDIKSASGINKLFVLILCCVGILLLSQFIEHMLDTSDYFNNRIEATLEGDSSNRDIIYKEIWNEYLYNSNIIQWLFGRGALSTLKSVNIYAHNDWLEIIFCQGLLGILILINYWKGLFKISRSSTFCESSRFCLFLIFCIFFVKTFFSMSVIGMPIYTTIMLGFSLADGFDEQHAIYKDLQNENT